MRFAQPATPDEIADAVRRHMEVGAYWMEPEAYATGLVSQILDALRHPARFQRAAARPRRSRRRSPRHYLETGRTAEGGLVQVEFHFERTAPEAVGSARLRRIGSRLLVDAAYLVAPGRAPARWST